MKYRYLNYQPHKTTLRYDFKELPILMITYESIQYMLLYRTHNGKIRHYLKHYWKDSGLHQAHYDVRDARRSWKANGSPRLRDAHSVLYYK